MNTTTHMLSGTILHALCALFAVTSMTGCVVHSRGDASDDYLYEDEVVETRYDDLEEYEEYEELSEVEEYEETTITTTTTTTTTTTVEEVVEDEPRLPSSVAHSPYLFEEGFEDQVIYSGGRMPVERLSPWMIEWSELSACEGSSLRPSVELQRDEIDLDQGEIEGAQHVRLDAPCGPDFSPVSLTTSLDGLAGASRLRFYARAADSIDAMGAGLAVIWGDEVVMDEPLVDAWMEYEIDLTQRRVRHETILSLMATGAGVIIDHIRID